MSKLSSADREPEDNCMGFHKQWELNILLFKFMPGDEKIGSNSCTACVLDLQSAVPAVFISITLNI